MATLSVFATTTTVTNSGNTFVPADITITQGDTVNFSITNAHDVVEVSQATYNANGNTSNGGFSLPFGGGTLIGLAPGTYYYVCTPHASLGMKGTITVNAAPSTGTPILTMIGDGDCTGGNPKFVELYANGTVNFANYSIENQSNANTTWSNTFNLAGLGTVTDDFVYVYYESATGTGTFASEFPSAAISIAPTNTVVNNNGDDRVRIVNDLTSAVVDQYGETDVDGTGTAWEYLDGFSKRNDGTGPDGGFVVGNWTYNLSGFDGLGLCQGGSSTFEDISGTGTYQLVAVPVVDTLVTFASVSATVQEAVGSYTLNLELNQAVGASSTVDVALLSGPSANLSTSFPLTATFAAGSSTTTVSVSVIDDALIEPNDTFMFILQNPSANLILGSDSIFTLIAEDDDTPLPIYTIGQVNTVDANGNPDSLNVVCEIQNAVVMGINYADLPDVSFYIHDATGGMGVFNAAGTAGYTVSEGDLINIRGTVGFFNGLTQLVSITSITATGTGALPAVTTVTALDESTEAELVKLSNVTVVSQSSWNTGVGSGFNVDVTDGTNTYSVRIDKSTDLYSMALPGCVLDITGIGSQFDNSSPYTSGYQLLPRYAADITVISACVTPTYTIADATEVDANGSAVLFGTDMSLKGIITSPDFRELQANGTEFSFADGTGGIWAFTTDSTISFDPVVGDSVIVYGNIGQSSGVTRIYIDSVFNLGAATAVSPVLLAAALTEDDEAELVTIEHLTLSSTWQSSGPSYNVDAVSDGGITYSIRVDADRAELFTVPLTTSNKFTLTGIGTQFDPSSPYTDGYQILPRFASDIEIETAINEITLENLSISPIPANDILDIAFNYNTTENATAQLVDVLGNVVAAQSIPLSNGYNKTSINVSTLSTGFYVLKIQTAKGVSTTNVLVK